MGSGEASRVTRAGTWIVIRSPSRTLYPAGRFDPLTVTRPSAISFFNRDRLISVCWAERKTSSRSRLESSEVTSNSYCFIYVVRHYQPWKKLAKDHSAGKIIYCQKKSLLVATGGYVRVIFPRGGASVRPSCTVYACYPSGELESGPIRLYRHRLIQARRKEKFH